MEHKSFSLEFLDFECAAAAASVCKRPAICKRTRACGPGEHGSRLSIQEYAQSMFALKTFWLIMKAFGEAGSHPQSTTRHQVTNEEENEEANGPCRVEHA